MKVKTNGSKLPHAWVVSPRDKGRRKIYNDNKIYLKNGEEFEIELYNPTQKNVLALISLDGKPISKSGLVVKSGERFYLDCFLDDLKKFRFETYNVEDSLEVQDAISKNGELEVFFYNEEIADRLDLSKLPGNNTEIHHHHHHNYYQGNRWYPNYYETFWCGTTTGTTTGAIGVSSNNISALGNSTTGTSLINDGAYSLTSGTSTVGGALSSNLNINNLKSTDIETGQIARAEDSNQKFKEIEMDFEENHISDISYKLLPESRMPKTSIDVSSVSMEKISTKLAESEYIEDLIGRLNNFNDLMAAKLIEKDEFKLIQEKTVKSMIEMSSTIEIEYIDDLGNHIASLGSLMETKLITEDEFKTIKSNLFNSIK